MVSSSSPGGILQAQPPSRAYGVSGTHPDRSCGQIVPRPKHALGRPGPACPVARMAQAAWARVTSAPEASGCLVAPPVFKTGGWRAAPSAGSIPVCLRVDPTRGMADRGGLGRDCGPAPPEASTRHRARRPRLAGGAGGHAGLDDVKAAVPRPGTGSPRRRPAILEGQRATDQQLGCTSDGQPDDPAMAPDRRVRARLSRAVRLAGCIAVPGMARAGSWVGRMFMHRHPS
jgi:hypothetical protein